MPSNRKGRSKSQTTGKAKSARSAIGQQSTSRSNHPIKQSKAFMAFIRIQSSKKRKENYSLGLGRQIKKEFLGMRFFGERKFFVVGEGFGRLRD